MILNKKLEDIEESDLQTLINDQVSEGKTIEYKAILPGNADGDKKEFLADVSSFANASGGDIIYGVREQSGIPVEICGLQINDLDAEILRLESSIRTGIAPRLPRVEIHPVSLPSKQQLSAIIIRIQKSYLAPHMVTFKNDSKFFTRNSRGKYQLDVSELRTAFVLSETTTERIRNFRAERLGMIAAGDTPAFLDEKAPKLVLHIVPLSAFDPNVALNIALLTQNDSPSLIVPLMLRYGGYKYPQYNFDGLLSVGAPPSTSYTQVFRNGIIESVDTTIFGASREKRTTSGNIYERRVLEALKRYLEVKFYPYPGNSGR